MIKCMVWWEIKTSVYLLSSTHVEITQTRQNQTNCEHVYFAIMAVGHIKKTDNLNAFKITFSVKNVWRSHLPSVINHNAEKNVFTKQL